MTITPGNLNLTVYQGYTYNNVLTWTDSNGVPIDLTGYSATLEARYNLTDVSPFLTISTAMGGITLGGALGTITLSISSAATSLLVAGLGVYNLQVVSSGGISDALLQGYITVQEMPTR